jgi:hypothetical protein
MIVCTVLLLANMSSFLKPYKISVSNQMFYFQMHVITYFWHDLGFHFKFVFDCCQINFESNTYSLFIVCYLCYNLLNLYYGVLFEKCFLSTLFCFIFRLTDVFYNILYNDMINIMLILNVLIFYRICN